MEQELNIIQNISNQTILSFEQKRTFALNFKKIIRFGNDEEIKQAKKILDSFQSKEKGENFYESGLETYLNIRKSRIAYSSLINTLQNYNNTIDKNEFIKFGRFIIFHYNRITDEIILEKANQKLRQSILKHPELAKIIRIKTPAKKQNTQEQKQEQINKFKNMSDNIFNKLDDYLRKHFYSIDTSNVYLNELIILKQTANNYKEIIGEQLYNETIRKIALAQNDLNDMITSMEQETISWNR